VQVERNTNQRGVEEYAVQLENEEVKGLMDKESPKPWLQPVRNSILENIAKGTTSISTS
jgi:hypothetical protein